jgi:hypothetical protein
MPCCRYHSRSLLHWNHCKYKNSKEVGRLGETHARTKAFTPLRCAWASHLTFKFSLVIASLPLCLPCLPHVCLLFPSYKCPFTFFILNMWVVRRVPKTTTTDVGTKKKTSKCARAMTAYVLPVISPSYSFVICVFRLDQAKTLHVLRMGGGRAPHHYPPPPPSPLLHAGVFDSF